MALNVVLIGGPDRYADELLTGVEVEDGFIWYQAGKFTGSPEAWYQIDPDAEPMETSAGPAQPAHYVGESKP